MFEASGHMQRPYNLVRPTMPRVRQRCNQIPIQPCSRQMGARERILRGRFRRKLTMSSESEDPRETVDTVLHQILECLEELSQENQRSNDLLREVIDNQNRQTELLEDLLRQGQK